MRHFILLCFAFLFNEAYCQTVDSMQTEGLFKITLNAQIHQIEISLTQQTFKEYDQAGIVISNGNFKRTTDKVFSLIPIYVENNALIQSQINFLYQEPIENGIRILVINNDNTTQVFEFIRVQ